MSAPAYHASLPYIDLPSEPELAAARALIAQEPQPPRAATTPLSPTFSPAIQTELARVASSTPLTPLSTRRYEAQDLVDDADAAPVLARAYTSAAYLSSRLRNLQLLESHGANAWLLSNYHLEAVLRRVEAQLAAARREVDEVNAARQRRQADVRAELLGLEEAWRSGVARVLETEVAVQELRASFRDELSNAQS
ncbi:hypothetical protein ED733_001020 [Metarhizium rileyi]|uniref:Breast carcinoma amplified sequence 2 n=1 Tax=Metarhizium rileyi (strain RCEF 4871) TaxID=1649241 RepID=A0A5C6G4U9_METRR|nr:hypothetical protein ED733_001020 [Metarhizium rileyi]